LVHNVELRCLAESVGGKEVLPPGGLYKGLNLLIDSPR